MSFMHMGRFDLRTISTCIVYMIIAVAQFVNVSVSFNWKKRC